MIMPTTTPSSPLSVDKMPGFDSGHFFCDARQLLETVFPHAQHHVSEFGYIDFSSSARNVFIGHASDGTLASAVAASAQDFDSCKCGEDPIATCAPSL